MVLFAFRLDLGFFLHEDRVIVVLVGAHVLIAFGDDLLQRGLPFGLFRCLRREELVQKCHIHYLALSSYVQYRRGGERIQVEKYGGAFYNLYIDQTIKGGTFINTYLIDYENVKLAGLKGIENLTEDDVVYLFYSENANTLTFSMHRKINSCKAHFNLTEVKTGKANALDFQLVTYLGYLIAMSPKHAYYIVSQDKGFKSACTFWQDRGVNVSLVSDLAGRDESKVEDQLAKDVRALIDDRAVADKVTRIILKYKTKQGINNALVREFQSQDNKKASELYKAIKPLLKDKKGK